MKIKADVNTVIENLSKIISRQAQEIAILQAQLKEKEKEENAE